MDVFNRANLSSTLKRPQRKVDGRDENRIRNLLSIFYCSTFCPDLSGPAGDPTLVIPAPLILWQRASTPHPLGLGSSRERPPASSSWPPAVFGGSNSATGAPGKSIRAIGAN